MWFSKYLVFSSLLFLVVMPGHAVSDPDVLERYRYYDVEGITPKMLRQSMNEKRLKHVRGGYDAYVYWSLKWRFRYDDDLRGCKITAASTVLVVKYTLPRWVDVEVASLEVRTLWEQYYTALIEHEHGHRDWGVHAAIDIEQSLLAMPYDRDCLSLRRDAHSLASRVLARYLRLEKGYDRETGHGATQGAIFP